MNQSIVVAEEKAKPGSKEACRFKSGFRTEVALDVVHAIGDAFLFLSESRGILAEVVDAVLLAY